MAATLLERGAHQEAAAERGHAERVARDRVGPASAARLAAP
jgi:hypothetical protein